MVGRFEWHITVALEHAVIVRDVADLQALTFSQIQGCPLLGSGTYCYLTGYDTLDTAALHNIDRALLELSTRGVSALRSKVENIVFDTKTGVNLIDGTP